MYSIDRICNVMLCLFRQEHYNQWSSSWHDYQPGKVIFENKNIFVYFVCTRKILWRVLCYLCFLGAPVNYLAHPVDSAYEVYGCIVPITRYKINYAYVYVELNEFIVADSAKENAADCI